jgi:hypothetical protein
VRALPHHTDRNQLRQELLTTARDYFTAPGQPLNPNHSERTASLLADAHTYTLAGAIQWVARNVSDEAADDLAAWVSSTLINGDLDDLNADIEVAS